MSNFPAWALKKATVLAQMGNAMFELAEKNAPAEVMAQNLADLEKTVQEFEQELLHLPDELKQGERYKTAYDFVAVSLPQTIARFRQEYDLAPPKAN